MNQSIRDQLLTEHGPFMNARAICKVLCYPSPAALAAARKRGKLPFMPVPLEGRPGLYASTEEIANIVQRSLDARLPHSVLAASRLLNNTVQQEP